jgi:hypothetical protein
MNRHLALKVFILITLLACGTPTILGQSFGCQNSQFELPNSFLSGNSIVSYASADFDQDGDLDFAIVGAQVQTVSIVRGDGYGGFGLPQSYPIGLLTASVAAGDFNSDGKLDLIFSGSQNHFSLLLNDGTADSSRRFSAICRALPDSTAQCWRLI